MGWKLGRGELGVSKIKLEVRMDELEIRQDKL